MATRRAVVFGGTGFLGRRAVSALSAGGTEVTVAARRPRVQAPVGSSARPVTAVSADVKDPASVARAVDGADAVVNCVGLYVESGESTFQSVHVEGARNVAAATARAGAALVHISGLGSDPASPSPYIRARGEGEAAVLDACPEATVLRPSVMFGSGDAFLSTLARISAMTPVIPLFGSGEVKLQPVWVDDVADAAVRAAATAKARAAVFELGGPEVLTYRAIVERVLAWTGRRRVLLPFPIAGWQLLAGAARILPSPPLTEGQVALMKSDNIVRRDARSFAALGLAPKSMAEIAPAYLARLG